MAGLNFTTHTHECTHTDVQGFSARKSQSSHENVELGLQILFCSLLPSVWQPVTEAMMSKKKKKISQLLHNDL